MSTPAMRLCLDCKQAHVQGRKGRYCCDCGALRREAGRRRGVQKRIKYPPNDAIDRVIRDHYAKRLTNGYAIRSGPSLSDLAQRLGWPRCQVVKRAAELGLSRIKERPWSQEEMALLEKSAHLVAATIAVKFRRRGFSRTVAAIALKLTRTGLRGTHDYYSARECASFFGMEPNVVLKWIRLGYLKARTRGTGEKGDHYVINNAMVRKFVANHPTLFDIRRVDQVWFLDMLLEGKLCQDDRGNFEPL